MTCPLYVPRPVDPHWHFYGEPVRCCGSCQRYDGEKCKKEKEMTTWNTAAKPEWAITQRRFK